MKGTVDHLSAWTSDDLIAEVCRRCAGDKATLRRCQRVIISALLAECDKEAASPQGKYFERPHRLPPRPSVTPSPLRLAGSAGDGAGHCARPPPGGEVGPRMMAKCKAHYSRREAGARTVCAEMHNRTEVTQ